VEKRLEDFFHGQLGGFKGCLPGACPPPAKYVNRRGWRKAKRVIRLRLHDSGKRNVGLPLRLHRNSGGTRFSIKRPE